MAFTKTPMRGMPEQSPREMELRNYVLNQIRNVYQTYGFQQIETPSIEHITNLVGDHGGENEKLIFRILKRGRSLEKALSEADGELCDGGLRYDLTVPLSRFYANNSNALPMPFKVMQMGHVWRADRPQRGRFRQFIQCDIDILGEADNLAEIELITATTEALAILGFEDLVIKINDRRILRSMALYAGFPEARLGEVFIILDKFDKIGQSGVEEELKSSGFEEAHIEKYLKFFSGMSERVTSKEYFSRAPGMAEDSSLFDNLDAIISAVRSLVDSSVRIIFDPTLVRGMGYYTGPVFEIALPGMAGSVAGGGRYDNMVGRFSNQQVPACGFSIGFERIIVLLQEQGFEPAFPGRRSAYLIDKKVTAKQRLEVLQKAAVRRELGETVFVATRRKNARKQKEELEDLGYTDFEEVFYE